MFVKSSPRFVGMVLGACASCLVMLGATADVAFAQSPELVVLQAFEDTYGRPPLAGVIQASDGSLYGTTSGGGAFGGGTVFKLDASGGRFALHSFGPIGSDTDGYRPGAGLIQASDGNFYGTTSLGPWIGGVCCGYGTNFKMEASGTFTTLYAFSGDDGQSPKGLIQASDGNFYGVTSGGGLAFGDGGTVFRITPSGALTTLYTFRGTGGADPEAALIQASDGDFYGTTKEGGPDGMVGTVFKIDASGHHTLLHEFGVEDGDGSHPVGALIQAADGNFYGTTRDGGAFGPPGNRLSFGLGTVFRMDAGGTFTTLHSFDGSDGSHPIAGLIQASDGSLYGTTNIGGAGFGTVFKLDANGTFTTLHTFIPLLTDGYLTDGLNPSSGALIQATDGNFYGTTLKGGAWGAGVLFRLAGDNTPIGTNVFVMPAAGFPVTVILGDVTSPGNTTATGDATPPPSGSTVDGSVWDISTTATYIGPLTICLPYHSAINPNPRLFHYVRGAWVDVTTGFVPATQVVCGTSMSLSPFAVLIPSAARFASFTARVEITRSHAIKKNGGDSFEVEGRGVLNAASNGLAPKVENVTVSLGAFSLTIPAGSFVKKADKDDDHGKRDRDDRDDRITTYHFKGVIAGVSLSAEIELGPRHTFRFEFEGQHASFGLVSNPVTVGLAIGDDVGQVVVKADIDK